MKSIRAFKPGTTVVQKLNQGFSRRLGVLSGGGPFWLPPMFAFIPRCFISSNLNHR
jgi:hypothetical protein